MWVKGADYIPLMMITTMKITEESDPDDATADPLSRAQSVRVMFEEEEGERVCRLYMFLKKMLLKFSEAAIIYDEKLFQVYLLRRLNNESLGRSWQFCPLLRKPSPMRWSFLFGTLGVHGVTEQTEMKCSEFQGTNDSAAEHYVKLPLYITGVPTPDNPLFFHELP